MWRADNHDSRDILMRLPKMHKDLGEFLVLASGGVDSSTLLWLAAAQGLTPTALFVDYGQPAAAAESGALTIICNKLSVPFRRVTYKGTRFESGEIRGRNAHLLHIALMEFPSRSGVVALGIHAGTGYADCSPEFMDLMQCSYEFHTRGAVIPVAPFLHWTKQEVFRLASKLKVPLPLTYSCEAGNTQCERCRSCLDRRLIVPRSVVC